MSESSSSPLSVPLLLDESFNSPSAHCSRPLPSPRVSRAGSPDCSHLSRRVQGRARSPSADPAVLPAVHLSLSHTLLSSSIPRSLFTSGSSWFGRWFSGDLGRVQKTTWLQVTSVWRQRPYLGGVAQIYRAKQTTLLALLQLLTRLLYFQLCGLLCCNPNRQVNKSNFYVRAACASFVFIF